MIPKISAVIPKISGVIPSQQQSPEWKPKKDTVQTQEPEGELGTQTDQLEKGGNPKSLPSNQEIQGEEHKEQVPPQNQKEAQSTLTEKAHFSVPARHLKN